MNAGSSQQPATPTSRSADTEATVHARHSVELRWTDFDGYGHLHTSAQFITLETGRARFVRSVLSPDGGPLEWILVHIEMDFVSELRWEEDLRATVAITIHDLGRTSLGMREAIEAPDGRLISRARSVIALWDPAARRTLALDDRRRAAVKALGV